MFLLRRRWRSALDFECCNRTANARAIPAHFRCSVHEFNGRTPSGGTELVIKRRERHLLATRQIQIGSIVRRQMKGTCGCHGLPNGNETAVGIDNLSHDFLKVNQRTIDVGTGQNGSPFGKDESVAVRRRWREWLCRRTRGRWLMWERYAQILHQHPLLPPRIMHSWAWRGGLLEEPAAVILHGGICEGAVPDEAYSSLGAPLLGVLRQLADEHPLCARCRTQIGQSDWRQLQRGPKDCEQKTAP